VDPWGKNVSTLVFETGRAVRLDRYADASGPVGDEGREKGFRSAVGTPVIVEGRMWGVIAAASALEETLPTDTEARLASFTELGRSQVIWRTLPAASRTVASAGTGRWSSGRS
jgi:GAF domain-containing protein